MTQDELDRIEARVQAWRTAHQIDSVECMAASADDVPALVAEVKRLRDEVHAAYQEGWLRGYNSGNPSVKLGVPMAMYDDFEQSDARKAMEGV